MIDNDKVEHAHMNSRAIDEHNEHTLPEPGLEADAEGSTDLQLLEEALILFRNNQMFDYLVSHTSTEVMSKAESCIDGLLYDIGKEFLESVDLDLGEKDVLERRLTDANDLIAEDLTGMLFEYLDNLNSQGASKFISERAP